MKKLLFLILLIPFFIGCQIYTDTSNPALNLNGKWEIKGLTGYYDHLIDLPYKLGDIWEFDYNVLIIRTSQFTDPNEPWIPQEVVLGEYYIGYILYQYYPSDSFTLTNKNTGEYIGLWRFIQSGVESAPSNDLIITPPMFPNLGLVFERI